MKQAVDFKSPGKLREDTIKILKNVDPSQFSVITGEDDALFHILEMGGKGMITATGNIPEASQIFCDIIRVHENGDRKGAEQLQEKANRFVDACFIRKNPIPLAALFNSPVYQPLISIRDTAGGKDAHKQLMALIETQAPSLKKYFS